MHSKGDERMNTVETKSFAQADLKKVQKCVQKLKKERLHPTVELVTARTGMHWAIVTAIMTHAQDERTGGMATKLAHLAQSESRAARPAYRERRKRAGAKRYMRVNGPPEQVIKMIMLDKGVDPALAEQVVQALAEKMADEDVRPSVAEFVVGKGKDQTKHIRMHGTREYTWLAERANGTKLERFVYRMPNWVGRLLVETLVKFRPVPEFDVRDTFVHGTNVFTIYTPAQLGYLSFAVDFAQWYGDERLTALENRLISRTYGRSLYRGSQYGHGRQNSRMFSDSERSDILNRTCIVCFCPEIARTIPVTDEGCGYVSCADIKVDWEECTFWREYVRAGEFIRQKDNGWKLTFTDNTTGQKYFVHTRAIKSLVLWKEFTGFYGVGKRPIEFTTPAPITGGMFGSVEQIASMPWDEQNSNRQEDCVPVREIELDPDSLAPYAHEYSFHRMLKFFGMNIFRFLFRRPVGPDKLLREHKASRDARRSFRSTPLYEFMRRLGMDEHGAAAPKDTEFPEFSIENLHIPDAWIDLCTVELMTSKELPRTEDHRDRRVQAFRLLWEERANANRGKRAFKKCAISRRKYENFRAHVMGRIRQIIEQDAKLVSCPPAPEVIGSGPASGWRPTYGANRAEIRGFKTAHAAVFGRDDDGRPRKEVTHAQLIDGVWYADGIRHTEWVLSNGECI